MDPPHTSVYEFDAFRVDPARRLLIGADGRPIRVTPKAFDTLVYFVQHVDVVLGKETLMRAIWSDTAVEENNLNQCISALRRVLGEKRSEPRYIVTVPGRGYRFVGNVSRAPEKTTARIPESMPRIAVLPFHPIAPRGRDESLELGMADTLIARLSCIRNVVVRPMSSVRKYSGLQYDVLSAGRELGVDSVLEGSLQRHGNRVRVTVRLLNVLHGNALWAGSFDNDITDIFALQDAIAEQVVQALSIELSKEDKTRFVKHHTQSPKAYQLYLKGRYYWWKNSPQEYGKSRDYFHRAIEEDPFFALGYCGLNSFYGYGAAWGLVPPDEGWPKAEWAVTKALEFDDQLAEAHLDLAALRMVCYLDWAGTEREMRRSLELAPSFDESHYAYSFFLLVMRRFPEAVIEAKQAVICNPFSTRISQHMGYVLFCARRFEEAIQQYGKALELDAQDASVCEALGDAYEQNGDYPRAIEHWTRALLLAKDRELADVFDVPKTKEAVAAAKRAAAAIKLSRLHHKREVGEYVPAIRFAREQLQIGDKGQALEWLRLACEERNVYALTLGCDPFYDSIRDDPSFTKLLRRMRLAVGHAG